MTPTDLCHLLLHTKNQQQQQQKRLNTMECQFCNQRTSAFLPEVVAEGTVNLVQSFGQNPPVPPLPLRKNVLLLSDAKYPHPCCVPSDTVNHSQCMPILLYSGWLLVINTNSVTTHIQFGGKEISGTENPSLVSKGLAVQNTSSTHTFSDFLNLHCDLDLECSNPFFFSEDTLAHDDLLSQQVWLQKDQQLQRYSRNCHIQII